MHIQACVVHAHTIIQRTCSWGHERRGKLCMTQGLAFFDGRDVHSDIYAPPHRMPRTPRSYFCTRGTTRNNFFYTIFLIERFVKYQVRKGFVEIVPIFHTVFACVYAVQTLYHYLRHKPYMSSAKAPVLYHHNAVWHAVLTYNVLRFRSPISTSQARAPPLGVSVCQPHSTLRRR